MTDMQPTHQQTLQQRRASDAWQQIKDVATRTPAFCKEYGSLVRGAPALILSDGLGQALAFYLAKAGGDPAKPHFVLYQQLSVWVGQELQPGSADLLPWLLQQSSATYRQATTETLAYLAWLKRFAEAKGWKGED